MAYTGRLNKQSAKQPVSTGRLSAPQNSAAVPETKISTLPQFLGGGAYNNVIGKPGELKKTEAKYQLIPGEPGKEGHHIFPVSLGGTSETPLNMENLSIEDHARISKAGDEALKEFNDKKISLPEARLKVLAEYQKVQDEKKGIKQGVLSNLLGGVKEAVTHPIDSLKKLIGPAETKKPTIHYDWPADEADKIVQTGNPVTDSLAMQSRVTPKQLEEAAPKGRLATAAMIFSSALPSKGIGQVSAGLKSAGTAGKIEKAASKSTPIIDDIKGSILKPKEAMKPLPAQQSAGRLSRKNGLPTTSLSDTGKSGQSILDKGMETLPAETPEAVSQPNRNIPYNGKVTELKKTVKERGFVSTVKESITTPDQIKSSIDQMYTVRNTNDLAVKARNFIKDFPNAAQDLARSNKADDITGAVTMELIKKHTAEGNLDAAIDLVEKVAPKFTESGRFSQLASLYNRLTPEGVLRFTQRQINKAMELNPKLQLKLGPEKAAKLTEMAKGLQNMADGPEKTKATQLMLKEVYQTIPSTVAEKIGTLQTMAQLLNPKTIVRNIGGNVLFAGLENVSQAVGTPLDKVLSKLRGSARTTALPSPTTQLKSVWKGLKQGAGEAWQGIDTMGNQTQFELSQIPVFQGKILGSLEKTMGVTLKAPDRAAYTAAFDDTIAGLMKAAKTDKPTKEMLDLAHHNGLYRTFQDTNMISSAFSKLKQAFNTIGIETGGKKWGLGDLILKYPKTPGNLLARGIDYSPAGFIKAVFEASKPLFGREFNQKAFVDSFARATVGSAGLVGTGIMLGKLGIITESPDKDKDVRNFQKTVGLGGYKINVSALKRFVMSGLNPDSAKLQPGDTLVSYDWAQPAAIGLSMGAKIGQKGEIETQDAADLLSIANQSLTQGAQTLAEQPLVTGMQKLFGYGGVIEGGKAIAKSAPASFVPTLLNQFNQFIDNTSRDPSDPNPFKESANLALQKFPVLSRLVPPRIGTFGQDEKPYQDNSNNIFNVFFNPAFVTKFKETPEAKMVLDIFERTGSKQQFPQTVSSSLKINGADRQLTPKEYEGMQRFVGTKTREVFSHLAADKRFMALPDDDKAEVLGNMLSDIGKIAKAELLGSKEINSVRPIYDQAQELKKQGKEGEAQVMVDGLSDADWELYKKIQTSETSLAAIRREIELLPTLNKISDLKAQGKEDQAQAVVDGLSDEDADYYKSLKAKLKIK